MIGQDDDRALGIEKADDVVVVGDAAAPMRDVAQTRAAEREQLGSRHERALSRYRNDGAKRDWCPQI